MGDNMSLRLNEARERRLENLMEATGEGTKSGAIDVAASFYIKMAGDNPGYPNGKLDRLVDLAIEEGNVTPEQITEILDTSAYPMSVEYSYDSGRE